MKDKIDFLEDINQKYATLEYELDQKLKLVYQKEKEVQEELESSVSNQRETKICQSLKAAKQRNFELLKSLEMAKARLRSRVTYSPLESILDKAIKNYAKEMSLIPSTTKKAYGPTFV